MPRISDLSPEEFDAELARLRAEFDPLSLDKLKQHRTEAIGRAAQLTGYREHGSHMTSKQYDELEEVELRQQVLGQVIDARETADQAASLERVRRAAQNPANRESGYGGGGPEYEVVRTGEVFRSRRPWEDASAAFRSGESMISRAHDVLEAVSDDVIPVEGKNRLAEQFSDPRERVEASRLAVAVSHPAYMSAFRKVLTDPRHGDRLWDAEERDAWGNVQSVSRAMSIGTGSLGFALPLQLDPSVILTNTGAANPFRQICTIKTTTSNTWNGVTSTGAAAQWLGEGVEAADGSPTLLQLQATPKKAATWIFGSYEAIGSAGFSGDVAFETSLPQILADAKNRLESAAYTTGAGGTGTVPQGILTAIGTANDSTVSSGSARAATDLYGILEGVSPRFRSGQGSRMGWMSSLTWLDKYRQVALFSGATTSIVNDNGPDPRAAGYTWYENSAMSTAASATVRPAIVGDWSQMYIADRWPGYLLHEPLVKGTASGFPTGQSGWFYVFRSDTTITTTNAFKVLRLT